MINRITATFAISAVLAAASIQAAESDSGLVDVASLGPQVGEQVPDFQLQDQNGVQHTLQSVMGPNGAMLLFHRSADW
jgi:hypothetical protein